MLLLKEIWEKLAGKYSTNAILIEELWGEIEKAYNHKRYYHNLNHLQSMFNDLEECKSLIENYDLVSFAVFYHDIIYQSHKRDNEEKSAEFAVKSLRKIGLEDSFIQACYTMILATKYHQENKDSDTRYFLDADMAILGSEDSQYQEYVKGVRKEYALFPDLVYNPGRKKVLYKFLDMPRIFQTDYFYQKYEEKAKGNIEREIKML